MPDETTAAPVPATAGTVFGTRLPLAQHYAELLRGEGIERGLLGPREGERIWQRHLLNSGVLGELVPQGCRVVDVGSGAGLPGVPLAIARPDLHVTLVESMQRRTNFLIEVVETVGLTNLEVRRARAEELVGTVSGEVVVARAVVRLGRLLDWTLPLTCSGGFVLAVKGENVRTELAELGISKIVDTPGSCHPPRAWQSRGATAVELCRCGASILVPPTVAVCVHRGTERQGG